MVLTAEISPLPEWKTRPHPITTKLHSLCSYMAMFPPSIPNYFITKYTKKDDIVLDPFSGRGTTPLEACMNDRIGIGNDRNPLAYVLTLAKVQTPSLERIRSRLSKLEKRYQSESELIDLSSEDWQIKMLFSDNTLRQLIFLKANLNWNANTIDAFITSLILGILHGNSPGYLSITMPNTFSMAPNYIQKYIEKNGLTKHERNVFDLLRKKIDRCYEKPKTKGRAYRSDARSLKKIKTSSVQLVMTSPPYTRVIRYGSFNWIRLWFLGEEAKEIDKRLLCTQSLSKYQEFMSDVLRETFRVLKPEGTAVFVIGDVKDRTSEQISNLAEFVWEKCAKPIGFQLKEPIQADLISDSTKVTKIWGERRGNATKVDRVLILSK